MWCGAGRGVGLSLWVIILLPAITHRSLGTLVISLQQLQSTGHLVLREALVDENLRVTPVSLTSPQPAIPKPDSPSR